MSEVPATVALDASDWGSISGHDSHAQLISGRAKQMKKALLIWREVEKFVASLSKEEFEARLSSAFK